MVARWMSFSHVWISFGRLLDHGVERDVGHHFVVDRLGRALGGRMGRAVDGVGYVQRAIKHTRHPNNMPELRRRFWAKNKWAMVATWLVAWALFNGGFVTISVGTAPGASRSWVASPSLVYAAAPGMNGGLRKVLWLKIPIVAAVWATATAYHTAHGVEPILWVQRALFIAGLTLPFDIRDLESRPAHMTTLPMVKSPEDVLKLAQCAFCVGRPESFDGRGEDDPRHIGLHRGRPLVLAAQCHLALWVLRSSIALEALRSDDEQEKEHYTGWRLDGVLVLPLAVWGGVHFVLV